MDPAIDGQAAHIVFGEVSDQTTANPMGVIPVRYLGWGFLDEYYGGGALHAWADIYFISMGALGFIEDLYYSPPIWGAEEVHYAGDLIRPADDTEFFYQCTTAGTTGSSEPTWPEGVGATVVDGTVTWTRGTALDVLWRYRVPDDAYGTVLACPYKPGWTAVSGRTANYLDFVPADGSANRRWTPLFVDRNHRYAKALREGRILLGVNAIGLTENAEGTGSAITQPGECAKLVLRTQVFAQEERWTSYAAIPTFPAPDGAYSMIDTDSFDASDTITESFLPPDGYTCGFLLGRDGRQGSPFNVLTEISPGLRAGHRRERARPGDGQPRGPRRAAGGHLRLD